MIKVVFVCLGNICRSPTAEGIFRHLINEQGLGGKIATDSSGTSGWHIGGAPDSRAQKAARDKGIDISDLRSRKSTADDFRTFDYVLAMDRSNYTDLLSMCPPGYEDRLHMFLSFAPNLGTSDVPDPYYHDGFDTVFDMLETASHGLLSNIRARHNL